MNPIYINASALKDAACHRRWWLQCVEGWRPKNGDFVALDFGESIHKALQLYYSNYSVDEAIMKATEYYFDKPVPEGDHRTMSFLTEVLLKYFAQRPLANDNITVLKNAETGKPRIEEQFFYPFRRLATGHDLILCGTMDMICEYSGLLTILDHKTSSEWNQQAYFTKYEWDIQAMFYTWIFEKLYGTRPYFVINGFFIKKPTGTAPKAGIAFARSSPIQFTQERLADFETWLLHKIELLAIDIEQNKALDNYNLSACSNVFNKRCPFFTYCTAPRLSRNSFLTTKLEKKEYNPLRFQETL